VRTISLHHRHRFRALAAAVLAIVASLAVMATSTPAIAAEPTVGDQVYVGPELQGYGGTGLHAIYDQTPADPNNLGAPDYWAYCVEHNISAKDDLDGLLQDPASYLGSNYYTSSTIQGKVLWLLAHSYPSMSLSDFGTAAGVPNISVNDAIEATQYAIWRYTDLTFDANWNWSSNDSKDAYWYLVNGANASNGMTPADFPTVTASITAPAAAQTAGSLVGPFTVHTSQATASLTVDPAYAVTDSAGNPVNAAAVTDGQQVYLDLRASATAGSATVTISAKGSNVTGKILSVPNQAGGAATSADHAQTLIMVAPTTATVSNSAQVAWAAAPVPTIGTTLVDSSDGDHDLAWNGGTLTDTVAYQNLTPGTSYTVSGELMRKSDGSATGITGSTTFTPATANGTVDVTFTVPSGHAGEDLVAFETLATGGTTVATHHDINSVSQTVSVGATPTIGTTLVDAVDGDHVLAGKGTLIDTVAYQNLTLGTTYTLSGELMVKSTGAATGITGSTTFTPATANGTVDVTFTVPSGYAGKSLVAFETLTEGRTTVATHHDINAVSQTVSVQTGTGTGGTGPTITTRTSASRIVVGHALRDTVTIKGFTPGGNSTGTAKLYGPFTSRTAASCTKANLAGTATFTPRNGTVRTTLVTVTRPGYYTWVASTSADAHNTAATHRCGMVNETTLVHKPSYGTPIVDTGFSGVEPGSFGARMMAMAQMTVRYAGVGVSSARANSTGITKGHVRVPHDVAQLGFLTPSAGLGDAIGTTVIVGHVSDDHDSPGAFSRLTKAKRGQIVKVSQGGHTYRFKVTSIRTYTRAHNGHPPASAFSTTGKHALVLISCAAKVVYPNGHFHYTRNVVVTATPVH